MASDAPGNVTPSPWWYRGRAFTIGSVYVAGFFFGALLTQLAGRQPLPAYDVFGSYLGLHGYRGLLALAVLLVGTCIALRLWGSCYLQPRTVWSPDALDDRLIVAGPFAFVRNPLYVGNLFLAAGMGLFATPLGFAIVVLGNVAVDLAMIHVEEPVLRARYGSAYDAYAAAVPALGWRLTPWHPESASTVRPSLSLGARAESFMLIALVAVIVAAVAFW